MSNANLAADWGSPISPKTELDHLVADKKQTTAPQFMNFSLAGSQALGLHAPGSESDEDVLVSDDDEAVEAPQRLSGMLKELDMTMKKGVVVATTLPQNGYDNGYGNTPDGMLVKDYVDIPPQRLPNIPSWLRPEALQGQVVLKNGTKEYVEHARTWPFSEQIWQKAMRFLLVAPRGSVRDTWDVKNFQRFMQDEADFTKCSAQGSRNTRETECVENCLTLALNRMKERLQKAKETPGDDISDIIEAVGEGDPLAALAKAQHARFKAANDRKAKVLEDAQRAEEEEEEKQREFEAMQAEEEEREALEASVIRDLRIGGDRGSLQKLKEIQEGGKEVLDAYILELYPEEPPEPEWMTEARKEALAQGEDPDVVEAYLQRGERPGVKGMAQQRAERMAYVDAERNKNLGIASPQQLKRAADAEAARINGPLKPRTHYLPPALQPKQEEKVNLVSLSPEARRKHDSEMKEKIRLVREEKEMEEQEANHTLYMARFNASFTLQRCAKRWLKRRNARRVASSVEIQRVLRGHRGRKHAAQLYSSKQQAGIAAEVEAVRQRQDAVAVEKAAPGREQVRKANSAAERARAAAMKPKLERAAVKIQRLHRGGIGRAKAELMRAEKEVSRLKEEELRLQRERDEDLAARKIQRAARGRDGREKAKRRAVEVERERLRKARAEEEEAERLALVAEREEAAVRIQALQRGKIGRRHVFRQEEEAIVRSMELKRLKAEEEAEEARRLNLEERRRLEEVRLAEEAEVERALELENMAVRLQVNYRARLGRKKATLTKENLWQKHLAWQHRDAKKIQSVLRGVLGRREAHELKRDRMATRIQSLKRGRDGRAKFKEERRRDNAARVLQKTGRGRLGRLAWKREEEAQEAARLAEERREAIRAMVRVRMDRAATLVQSKYRGKLARDRAEELREDRREVKRRELYAVELLQRCTRGMKGRKMSRSKRHEYDAVVLDIKRDDAALRLQTLHRGRKGRKDARWKKMINEEELRKFRISEGIRLEREAKEEAIARKEAGALLTRVGRGQIGRRKAREARRDREAARLKEAERREEATRLLQRVERGRKGRAKAAYKQSIVDAKASRADRIAREELRLRLIAEEEEREAAILKGSIELQRVQRGHVARVRVNAMRKERDEALRHAEETAAAINIQRVQRGNSNRRESSRKLAEFYEAQRLQIEMERVEAERVRLEEEERARKEKMRAWMKSEAEAREKGEKAATDIQRLYRGKVARSEATRLRTRKKAMASPKSGGKGMKAVASPTNAVGTEEESKEEEVAPAVPLSRFEELQLKKRRMEEVHESEAALKIQV